MWNYRNPVRIEFGAGRFGEIAKAIAGRPYCLVTYPDAAFTTMTKRLVARCRRTGGTHSRCRAESRL